MESMTNSNNWSVGHSYWCVGYSYWSMGNYRLMYSSYYWDGIVDNSVGVGVGCGYRSMSYSNWSMGNSQWGMSYSYGWGGYGNSSMAKRCSKVASRDGGEEERC